MMTYQLYKKFGGILLAAFLLQWLHARMMKVLN